MGWFFCFCFRLRQPSFHWIIRDGVINRLWKKWKHFWFFWLQFRQAYDSTYDFDFWFSLGHSLHYYSDYNSNSDSVANENQHLQSNWFILQTLEETMSSPSFEFAWPIFITRQCTQKHEWNVNRGHYSWNFAVQVYKITAWFSTD